MHLNVAKFGLVKIRMDAPRKSDVVKNLCYVDEKKLVLRFMIKLQNNTKKRLYRNDTEIIKCQLCKC